MKDINKFFKQEWESCLWNYEKHTRRKWFSNSPIRKGKRLIEFIKSAVQEIFKSNNFSCELCPSVQKKETGRKKKKKLGQHLRVHSNRALYLKDIFQTRPIQDKERERISVARKYTDAFRGTARSLHFLPSFIRPCATNFSDESNRSEPSPPPPLQFQKAFGRNSNIRFRAECRLLSTLRPICILLRPAVADHHLIVYSWSRLSFPSI